MKHEETELLYVFDMRFDRFLRLFFVAADDEQPRKSYPRTSDEKGDAPSQFNRLVVKETASPDSIELDDREELGIDEDVFDEE